MMVEFVIFQNNVEPMVKSRDSQYSTKQEV